MFIALSHTFVADAKLVFGYNFVAPLKAPTQLLVCVLSSKTNAEESPFFQCLLQFWVLLKTFKLMNKKNKTLIPSLYARIYSCCHVAK